jgi:peptidyl-prolyl cis-trans isomerase B (cyclophilin B)
VRTIRRDRTRPKSETRLPVVRTSVAACILVSLTLGACGGGQPRSQASGGCEHVAQPTLRQPANVPKPTQPLDARRKWQLVVDTSCGSFTIALDPPAAPHAAASMVALARAGFFDGTTFHRIVPGFVIQGGDPTATGNGGPGYTTVDPPPRTTRYTRGVVAMAKTAAEPPGSAGSQFFVVTGADIGLPPDYAPVGTVGAGLATVTRIAQLGSAASGEAGTPSRVVLVRTVRVVGG